MLRTAFSVYKPLTVYRAHEQLFDEINGMASICALRSSTGGLVGECLEKIKKFFLNRKEQIN